MKYQILQIRNGIENILVDTDSKKEAKEHYDRDSLCRVRINGKTLLLFQAEAWANGKPIRDYKSVIAKAPRPKPVTAGSKKKAVIQLDSNGKEIKRYESLAAAADAMGYESTKPIKLSCNTGNPTLKGSIFRWAV